MKFGHFDDANREYVITTPRTPLPWINYLGNQDFFTLISNTCGGYSFYKDARLLRITRYRYNDVPYDGNGKYIYIKDENTVWNTGWQPSKTEADTAWATLALVLRRTECLSASSTLSPWETPAR